MSRFPGNIIKLPNVTPTQNSASGVWSLKDQLVYQRNNLWPFQRDPYFNYTTLLLQGDVPNTTGPQAMTLPLSYNADASTNNFLVTPNGDVGPKPFSPYFGGNYSVYFDGSGDYLNVATNAAFNFGTGDATVEFWFNAAGAQPGNYPGIVSSSDYNTSGSASIRYSNTGYSKKIFMYLNGGGDPVIASASTVEYGVWAHVAIVRQGTSLKLYLNGFLDASVTISASLGWNLGYGELRVGRGFDVDGVGGYFNGYLSNIRLVKGTPVYTANFTPSTQPLQNIPNTSLLTCQSNRFIDNSTANSGSGFTITRNGDSRITDNSPFVSTDFTTGAGYFDGNGDYLSVANNTAFDLGSGDFTIEFWISPFSITSSQNWIAKWWTGGSQWVVQYRSAGTDSRASQHIRFAWNGSSVVDFDFTIPATAWGHFALVKSSGTLSCYFNGTASTTTASVGTLTATTDPLTIGQFSNGSTEWTNAYLSNVRIVKGVAVYTGNFSPPSLANLGRSGATSIAAYPSTTNVNTSFAESATSLLTLQTRAPSQNIGFIDSSPNEFIVTKNGNTTQGTFSPFSPTGWGFYLADQQNNTVNFTSGAGTNFQFTGDFTIEAWVYPDNSSGDGSIFVVSDNVNYFALNISISANVFNIYTNGGSPAASFASDIPVGKWSHIAMVRNGSGTNNIKVYVDGQQKGQLSNTSTLGYSSPAVCRIGGGVASINRYYSNLRVCKSAVYTTAFTPSTSPLTATSQNATNCVLLTAQNNRFVNNVAGATATTSGSPSVQAFSPFAPANAVSPLVTGGSGYFDGGGDSLVVPSNVAFNFSSSDFTIEFWFYPLEFIAEGEVIEFGTGATVGDIQIVMSTSGFTFGTSGVSKTFVSASLNQWYHLAGVKVGTTYYLYINGTRNTTQTSGSPSSSSSINICSRNNTTNYVKGYMSGLRISNVARYTDTIIPVPTTPPTAIPNTSLLLNFTNGAAVDASGKNVVESIGTVQTSNTQAKWNLLQGGSSVYVNGDGNYLKMPCTPINALNGDFTLEAWVYPIDAGRSADAEKYGTIISIGSTGVSSPELSWFVRIVGGVITEYFININSTTVLQVTGLSVSLNAWHYFAVVRSGTATGNVKLYIDGSLVGTSSSANTSAMNFTSTQALLIARNANSASYQNWLKGYFQNIRVSNYARTVTSLPTGPFPIG